jgi:adenine-specific DNA-methyltransferase
LVRGLFLDGLGGCSLHMLQPQATPFAGAMTTAVIACFEVGTTVGRVRLELVDTLAELRDLEHGEDVARGDLARATRWSPFLHGRSVVARQAEIIRLGDLVRVHRGLVTGANDFFILTRDRAQELSIQHWCRPVISGAEEVLASGGVVRDSPQRKLLLTIPRDVDRSAHPELDAYLRRGEAPTGDRPAIRDRYIARHRRPWWYLGDATPPPVVATYMARQPPFFARNPDRLAVVNIAHGLYPRRQMSEAQLGALVDTLNGGREHFRGSGRTYHGGLEKFEPREMEALSVHLPESL